MTFESILIQKRDRVPENIHQKFGLTSNPFPKSGMANINEPTEISYILSAINNEIVDKTARYVADSLYSVDNTENGKLVGTITGDYGVGKTQLLLFIRALILKYDKNSFIVYINNPGAKISELIDVIIDNIGKEQFKKYLWGRIIDEIQNSLEYRELLVECLGPNLFSKNPLDLKYWINHKSFLNDLISQAKDRIKLKELNNILKKIILDVLSKRNDEVIAQYFYYLISEDLGVNMAWSTLVSGVGLYTGKNSVKLLNAIISILREQGYRRVYFLIDEFEDITSVRLTKREVDNYSYNLRTLMDEERSWCMLIAMTSGALKNLNSFSPPLFDRITERKIEISRLSDEEAKLVLINHLNLVRKSSDSLFPFTDGLVTYLNLENNGIPRLFLKHLYFLIEKATECSECEQISEEFAKRVINGSNDL